MRNGLCPLCGAEADGILQLQFSAKMKLPTQLSVRHCTVDNFLFTTPGRQEDYNEYYASIANDSCHAELSGDNQRSPVSKLQKKHLVRALGSFFERERKVLDFGCGEGCLLVELASDFPTSNFLGFDPSPAAQTGSKKAAALGLDNVSISGSKKIAENGPYDLVIASHVVEHLIDLDLLELLNAHLADEGLLYLEVPNANQYTSHERREFLYYFDRLHVNHFTPQSLARLCANYGLGYLKHFEYAFPYRDGGEYPALGMLFKKRKPAVQLPSPSIIEVANRYILNEQLRAKLIATQFDGYEGLLVWGAGDNFFRSLTSGGPLAGRRNMIVLDRRPQDITIEGQTYKTEEPLRAFDVIPGRW